MQAPVPEAVFAVVFATVWIGAVTLTLNVLLLARDPLVKTCLCCRHTPDAPALLQGGRIIFFQSLATVGYCLFPLVVRARASCLSVRALCLTCLTHGLQLASILCLAWGNKAYQGALLGAGACATMPLASISLEHTDFLHQRRRGMGAALLRAVHREHRA